MKSSQAKKILRVLDRLNARAELIGKMILQNNVKPAPIPIRVNDRFKLK